MSEGNKEDLKHWFCFTYTGNTIKDSVSCTASTYTGYRSKNITLKIISENKENAGVDDKATLIAVSYLGHMTRSDMMG